MMKRGQDCVGIRLRSEVLQGTVANLNGFFERCDEAIPIDRLFDERIGSKIEGFPAQLAISMAGDEDSRRRGTKRMNLRHQRQSVHVRHFNVAHDRVVINR